MELPKHFDHKTREPELYKEWETAGFFNPDRLPTTDDRPRTTPFTIMMPPPNVTGVLHMGHAMATTIQDILIRYKRMQGFKTLWLPGTDHAAIATQSKVEKELKKTEDKSRHDLGREEFLKRVERFAQESHDTIVKQTKRLGASCDWSREAFTLDEPRSLAVRTLFKMMYDDGLIYRGNRVVNWDPKGQTTIADDEIVYEEREAFLYTFKYGPECPIEIATTRPETKVGDTAIAVHPEGKWKDYIGKTFTIADFAGETLTLKVIGDTAVDPEFGTGALGVTPAHSMIDFEMAGRHNLPLKQVINEYAKMTVGGEGVKGKKTTEARETIVKWLGEKGLITKPEQKIKQNIATAERTGGIIEPLPKLQWFVAVDKTFTRDGRQTTLKQLMRSAVESNAVSIIPDYFNKTYFHWIDNLRDWCISRQIWYGHRIPVWYRSADTHGKQGEEIFVGTEAPKGDGWMQDPDTLDTWFSSSAWTFSTLGWPERTKDLTTFHPTDVLETGYEILFFWVARMILMTGYALNTIPFKTVYLHGTVRDDKGRKMSKSLGNGIDPIEIAEEFGADAGRMALVVGMSPGTDTKISKDKIRGYRNFTTKLWNMTAFVLKSTAEQALIATPINAERDKAILAELVQVKKEITGYLDEYKLHLAAEAIYHYTWHTVADKIIEEVKTGAASAKTLRTVFAECVKMLHPFMPFVTEEIWGLLPKWEGKTSLIVESW